MSEWRFEVDEVGEDADDPPEDQPVEKQPLSLENALFVALGALTMVGLVLFVVLP